MLQKLNNTILDQIRAIAKMQRPLILMANSLFKNYFYPNGVLCIQ